MQLTRVLAPAAGVLLALCVYGWFLGPAISSLREDLAFLHHARIQQQKAPQK